MMETPHFRHARFRNLMVDFQNLSMSGETNYTLSDLTFTTFTTFSNFTPTVQSEPNHTTLGTNETNSTRSGSPVDPTVHIYAIYVSSFMIIFCTLSLVANVVILCSICFMRTRVNPTLYISLSLAGADTFSLFFFALGLVLFSLLPRLGIFLYAPCVMLMIEALRMGAIMTTLFHLAALAVNHYLGILLPLHYPVYMTRRNIQYCIVVLWTIPSSLLILDMFFLEGDGFNECPYEFLKRAKFRTRFSVPFFTTLVMMTFIYVHIYKLVCKHQRQPINGRQPRSSTKGRSSGFAGSQVNEKAIITTLMILGSTIFGWLPAFTYFALCCEDCVLKSIWKLGTVKEFIFLSTVNFLLISKTATNSYIYAFRMKEIKVALRRMKRKLLICLFAPNGHYDPTDWVETGLTRTTSRQSTTRSRMNSTFVQRMNSYHEHPPMANGTSKETYLRRCRSTNISRHNNSGTSV